MLGDIEKSQPAEATPEEAETWNTPAVDDYGAFLNEPEELSGYLQTADDQELE